MQGKSEQKIIKKTKLLLKFIGVVLFIGIAIFGFIWIIQPSFFFFPWHDVESYDRLRQDDRFEEVIIENKGKILHGWFKPEPNNEIAPLLIFFSGNANNSSNACAAFIDNDTYSYFEGYHFLMIDYPGYGLSEGKPSDKTMFDAALATYDYAQNLEIVDKNNIVIMGFSIGTGPATYLASQRDVQGLILLAPYDCALSLYNNTMDIFHGPMELLTRYKFQSKEYAQSVAIAPLLIASQDDEIIPYELSVNLSRQFSNNPVLITLEGPLHNDIISKQETLLGIQKYLTKQSN